MFPGFHAYDLIIVLVILLMIFGLEKLPKGRLLPRQEHQGVPQEYEGVGYA
jgi:hypothetical protein